jgi:hypothetical protein
MARQQDSCWRCGTPWSSEGKPALRLIAGDADADRWTNEGGSIASEVTLTLPATATAATR